MRARDDTAAVIDSTLAGGPRVLHIGLEQSTVPRRLAQEHDREVECLRWPLGPGADEQGVPATHPCVGQRVGSSRASADRLVPASSRKVKVSATGMGSEMPVDSISR